MCLELGFVWLVYFGFGIATQHNMPVWLTALLVIVVDRTVSFIADYAKGRRALVEQRQVAAELRETDDLL